MLNHRQIEGFRAVMLTGSISKAAEMLHVSQPAVSRLLAHMEVRLGLLLFERIKGRLYPTPEARRLYQEVEQVHLSLQRVNDVVADLLERRSGTLHIAVSPSLGLAPLIPAAVTEFRRIYPDVKVLVRTLIASDLVHALITQHAEVGVAIVPLTHPGLHAESIYENHLVALIPAEHPLAKKVELETSDLESQYLIGFGSDTPYGQRVHELFGDVPGLPKLAVEVRLTHIACAMVRAGAGIAIVDEVSVAGALASNVVVRPIRPRVPMPLHMLYSNAVPLSQLAREFMGIVRTLTSKTE
jgi:DNA-binding transcriptional LysR family regulator